MNFDFAPPLNPFSGGGPSDPLLEFVLWIGIGVIMVSCLMLGAVILLRVGLFLRQRRERRFLAQWRPLMTQYAAGVLSRPPPLAAADRYRFLKLWCHYQESLRGESKTRLNWLAASKNLGAFARALLKRRGPRERLLGIITLGHLGDAAARQDLRLLAGEASPLISLSAARALLLIDAVAEIPWLLSVAAERQDWPIARIAAMLAEVGADHVTAPLAAALESAAASADTAGRLPRLLRLGDVAHAGQIGSTVRRVLETVRDPQVTAASLNVLRDPLDIKLARDFAGHDSWEVRVAAAKALGRLGEPEDRDLLTGMLSDGNWWVRYRAAHSLAGLSSAGGEGLGKIRETLSDRFAVAMLDQVIAERA